ncbi:AAA family ATPase [Pseudomonadota bacterium]|nr:AAA family ATPase [Pseudomonadota bacterium]
MKNFPWIDKKISSIDLSNLSHALIVEGQEGVGKNQICQYLINGLLNEKNSENLIKNNSHPDLFCINNETLISYFQREDKDKLKNKTKKIPVGFIREAIDFVLLKSGLSKNKILFIDGAENLTISSQNALLKTLEEPPQNTYIIIQSNRFKCLNQTIYSRCQLIHFNNLSQDELYDWAEDILQNKKDKSIIPSYMTPKKVSQLIEDGLFEDLKKLNNYLYALFNKGIDGKVISDVIDLNLDFNEKLNYIIDFALSISKEGTSNIHPVRLSDFIQELSNFRENLFEINSLNQRYSLHHLLLKIPT